MRFGAGSSLGLTGRGALGLPVFFDEEVGRVSTLGFGSLLSHESKLGFERSLFDLDDGGGSCCESLGELVEVFW